MLSMSILNVIVAAMHVATALPAVVATGVHANPNKLIRSDGELVETVAAIEHDIEEPTNLNLAALPWKQYSGLSMVNRVELHTKVGDGLHPYGVLSVQKQASNDRRGSDYYVCGTTINLPLVIMNVPEADGLRLWILDNPSPVGSATDGRFLSAFDYYGSDRRYSGHLRVSTQFRRSKSILWEVAEVGGKTVLRVKSNTSAPKSVGWYLTVPPGSRRDKWSSYVAIGPDSSKASEIKMAEL